MSKMKLILDLSPIEACNYFLNSKIYCNLELPEYVTFDPLLKKVSDFLKGKNLSDCFNNKLKPNNVENVNYKILNNKDGQYAWRPFEIIHPEKGSRPYHYPQVC